MNLGWIYDLFKKQDAETIHLGANLDTRTEEEQQVQDTYFEETVSAPATLTPIWKEIPKEQIRTFGVQNQTGKSDCVAETRRKLKRVLLKVNHGVDLDFSSTAFYRKRKNYPQEGMIAADAIRIDSEEGMTLDALVPSDFITTESAANALKPEAFNDEVAKVFRTSDTDVIFKPGDLDTVAATIQLTRKAVMGWFFFTSAEWSLEVPVIKDNFLTVDKGLRHSVSLIEPAMYKGREGIWIEDSAQFGKISRRFVTREFYEARNWFASYPIAFKFEPDHAEEKPTFDDGNVSSLQDCLKYEGYFPTNIESTGYYGATTTQAVKDFQKKYNLKVTGLISPETRTKLHSLYP